jgi:hypothetical protein
MLAGSVRSELRTIGQGFGLPFLGGAGGTVQVA